MAAVGRSPRGSRSPFLLSSRQANSWAVPIRFDDSAFAYQGQRQGALVWSTSKGDGLELSYHPAPPDIHADLDKLDELRRFYRRTANSAGLGVIEIESRLIAGCKAVRTICKAAQQPTGRTYLAALTFPFRDFSYVLAVRCEERGTTGLRDTFVLNEMLFSGEVTLKENKLQGWLDDPYDPAEAGPMTRNKSERPEFDARTPDHPLSRARAVLSHLERTIAISDDLKRKPTYVWSG
jgi:hypothetical protein